MPHNIAHDRVFRTPEGAVVQVFCPLGASPAAVYSALVATEEQVLRELADRGMVCRRDLPEDTALTSISQAREKGP
jgi:hypothetical protein